MIYGTASASPGPPDGYALRLLEAAVYAHICIMYISLSSAATFTIARSGLQSE
jgi:hypothetical protein